MDLTAGRYPRLRTDELASAWLDAPGTPMQIALLGVVDAAPFRAPEEDPDLGRVRDELLARAQRVPALRRRVRWTRPGQGRPVWVPVPPADLAGQVEHVRLPPGADLPTWAAERAARPLDRRRPPWRIEVVDGLGAGAVGLLVVLHHLLADGQAGVALTRALLDPDPEPGPVLPADREVPPPPRGRDLAVDNLRSLLGRTRAGHPPSVPGTSGRPGGSNQLRQVLTGMSGPEPRTSLRREVGAGRRAAVVERPLDEVHGTAAALGVTVNDLLLTAVTAGLRALLTARGDDLEGLVLRATVPAATGRAGQVMALLVVPLPVGEPDPGRRLALVHAATARAKAGLQAAGGDVGDLRLPAPLARVALVAGRRWGSRRVTLSVTDVPGPAEPLWLAGARLLRAVPFAPLVPGVPLAVAALSYAGTLTVTVAADSSVPDVGTLAAGIAASLDEVRDRARQQLTAG